MRAWVVDAARAFCNAVTAAYSALVEFGTAAVVVGSIRVVVAGRSIGTSCDFKLVAYTVAIGIRQAVAVAVVAGFWSVAFAVASAVGNAITAAYTALIQHVTIAVASAVSDTVTTTHPTLVELQA